MNILKTDRVFGLELKLMLLGINLLLLLEVNAARHNLLLLLEVNDARHNLLLLLKATLKAKTVNGEVQLQALVDGKKIIITESILILMGSKTTAWNEFSSTMASAIIYLATNQKFNFSKYIFECMVKNLDNVSRKFFDVSKKQRSRRPNRKDTEVPQPSGPTTNVAYKSVNEEMDDSLERAATTATGLEAEHDNGNIDKTQSKVTLNEPSSSGTSSGSGYRCQETMGDTIAQTRSENVFKLSNDPLFARGNTLRSGKDRLKLEELMALCTTIQLRVLALETTQTTKDTEIASLKKRVKKLERRNKLRTHELKRVYRVGSSRRVESSEDEGLSEEDASKQGRIADIDANEDIYLVNVQTDEDMFGVNDLDGDEVIVKSVDVNTAEETRSVVEKVTAVIIPVSAATTTTTTTSITDVEMTLAQALEELKSAKPKANKVVIQKPKQDTTTPTLTTTTATTTITAVSIIPKAKGIVFHDQEQAPTPTVSSQHPSHVKAQDKGKGKMVKPEPVKKMSKKELLRLDEELAFKLQSEEEEEERLAREKAQQLAQRLQAQEQDEFTDAEKARLFVQFLDQRRKHFTAKRAEEKRNIPLTRVQQRSIICTYLKNMEGWKPKSLKNKTELVEESSKKVEVEIAHESNLKRTGEELE
ncbi:hypothetical protein Tco_0546548 [Tanacetum coccineum]